MGTSEFTAGGNPAMDYHPIQGRVVASCWDKLQPDGPLGSYTDLPCQYIELGGERTNHGTVVRASTLDIGNLVVIVWSLHLY